MGRAYNRAGGWSVRDSGCIELQSTALVSRNHVFITFIIIHYVRLPEWVYSCP